MDLGLIKRRKAKSKMPEGVTQKKGPDLPSWKQELNKCLQSLGFLCNNTEQIVVNVNQGKVCDVKQTVRIK